MSSKKWPVQVLIKWHTLYYNYRQPKQVELNHREQEVYLFVDIVFYAQECQCLI